MATGVKTEEDNSQSTGICNYTKWYVFCIFRRTFVAALWMGRYPPAGARYPLALALRGAGWGNVKKRPLVGVGEAGAFGLSKTVEAFDTLNAKVKVI